MGDLLLYALSGALFGYFRRRLGLALLTLVAGYGADLLVLPLGVTALTIAYGAGWAFFHRGPRRGLLRLASFAIAMMLGMTLSLP